MQSSSSSYTSLTLPAVNFMLQGMVDDVMHGCQLLCILKYSINVNVVVERTTYLQVMMCLVHW